jgi:hypothetical protein
MGTATLGAALAGTPIVKWSAGSNRSVSGRERVTCELMKKVDATNCNE